jgi:hypothetical protein
MRCRRLKQDRLHELALRLFGERLDQELIDAALQADDRRNRLRQRLHLLGMQSRAVARRRDLDDDVVGQVGDPAAIGNVHGIEALLFAAGKRLHDRDGEFAGRLE